MQYFLRDEEGRSLHQVALESDLYPFMLAASAESHDVGTINYLLRRSPGVLDQNQRRPGKNILIKTRGTKRNRE